MKENVVTMNQPAQYNGQMGSPSSDGGPIQFTSRGWKCEPASSVNPITYWVKSLGDLLSDLVKGK